MIATIVDGPFVRLHVLFVIGHVEHRSFGRRVLMLVRLLFALFALLTFLGLLALLIPSQGRVVPAFGMYDERAGHGLILDRAASESHSARAGDGFGLKVGGRGGLGRVLRLSFGTLVGSRFDLNGECSSCQ